MKNKHMKIMDQLEKGKVRVNAIGKIHVENKKRNLVELDFLYAPPNEYIFTRFYYSGSP